MFWSVCYGKYPHTWVLCACTHSLRIGVGLSRCAHTHVGCIQMCVKIKRNVRDVCICFWGIPLPPHTPTGIWKKWDGEYFWDSTLSLRD